MMGFHIKIGYKDAIPFIIKIAEFESKISSNNIVKWINSNLIRVEEKDMESYLNEVILEIK